MRSVLIPPALSALLCAHLKSYRTTPDGRLFRTARDRPLQDSATGRTHQPTSGPGVRGPSADSSRYFSRKPAITGFRFGRGRLSKPLRTSYSPRCGLNRRYPLARESCRLMLTVASRGHAYCEWRHASEMPLAVPPLPSDDAYAVCSIMCLTFRRASFSSRARRRAGRGCRKSGSDNSRPIGPLEQPPHRRVPVFS